MPLTVPGRGHVAPERVLAAAAILLALVVPERVVGSGPVLCPFRRATGRSCPACGLTRSWSAALHGRPRASVALHPLGLATLAAAAGIAVDHGPARRAATRVAGSPSAAAGLGVLWIVVWLLGLRRSGRIPRPATT